MKLGTTHYLGSSHRARLVTFQDQHLTRPCLADHVLGGAMLVGLAVDKVNLSVCCELCVAAFKTSSVKTFVL